MANVRLTPQVVNAAAVTPSFTGSLSTGDTYLISNNGRVSLHFKKVGASDCIVTIPTPGTVDSLAIADRTDTVPATTGERLSSKYKPSVYNDPNGDMSFTVDEVTGLSVAVIQN